MKLITVILILSLSFISCKNPIAINENSEWNQFVLGEPGGEEPVDDPENNIYFDTFYTGKSAPKPVSVDYLFITDNSCSFGGVAKKVKQALIDIPLSSYSNDSVMGVMSSMVSKYPYSGQIHAGIRGYTGIEKEPGFLSLVSGSSISTFKSQVPGEANHYPMKGCSNKWFTPGEKNSSGDFCFEAHMQNPYYCTACEPGLHALEQALKKFNASGKKLFRPGSYVHVINVTDETYPGCGNAEIVNNTPTAQSLKKLAMKNTNISGFKIHAIGRERSSGKGVDRKIAEDAGGIFLEMSEYSYASVIEKMMDSGTYEKAIFKLEHVPSKIHYVTVDGLKTTKYTLSSGGVIEVHGVDTSKPHDISVKYSK